jgi:hypothetical protein
MRDARAMPHAIWSLVFGQSPTKHQMDQHHQHARRPLPAGRWVLSGLGVGLVFLPVASCQYVAR